MKERQKPVTTALSYLIPIAYLAFVFWLQPANYLGDPISAQYLGRLVYDDADWIAVATRALNAQRKLVPARLPDPCIKWRKTSPPLVVDDPPLPLLNQYFLEYPNLVISLFRGAFLFVPDMADRPLPRAVLEACQEPFMTHMPATRNEIEIWHGFRRLIRTYEVAMLLCFLALVTVLRRGYDAEGSLSAPAVLLLLPSMLYFALARFDVLPALLTALSLACLSRNRIAASAAFLALGAMVKVYPIFLAPLILRYLLPDLRRAITWALVAGATIAAVFSFHIWQIGLSATLIPFQYQLSRSLEALTIYGSVVPRVLGTEQWKLLRLGALILTIGLSVLTPVRGLPSLLRRGAMVLIIFILLQVFFSPQWIVWLTPLLAPLARRDRSLFACLIVFDLVMFLNFPVELFHPGLPGHAVALYSRFAMSGLIVGLLLREELTARQTARQFQSA